MTTTTSPAGAPLAPRPAGPPPGRLARLIAALGPHATAVRVAGGLLTLIGALLPWATFVLNSGPYPDKATLQYFVAPFGVTGFRLQLLVFGIAALVLTFAPVPARGRLLRGLAWGIIGIAVINGLYIAVEGGGLGAITVADGSVAFGAVVTLLAGVLVELGARAGGVEPRPVWTWRFGPWVERVVLVVVYVLLLFVVAATLTSGGTGGAANPYSGAVFLSFLAALGGAFAALHASGLMTWVATVSERHRVFSVVVLLVIALALPLTAAGNEYWMTVAANIGVYAATAIGLNIVVGLAGLLDLGYVAFLGIGAFTAANLSGAAAAKFDVHLPFALVMVISAVIAGLFGAVVGSPTLRVRGDYLAIVTLAFGEIFVRTAQNNICGLTGGSNAIPDIPQVVLFGIAVLRPDHGRRPPAPGGRPVLRADRVARRPGHAGVQPPQVLAARARVDRDPRGRGRRAGDGHPDRPGQDPRVPLRRHARRVRGGVLRAQDRDGVLRELPVPGVGDAARGGHPRRHGHGVGGGARRVGAVRAAREAPRVLRVPAAAVRHRPHRDHAVPPAGSHPRSAPAGRARARPRRRAPPGGIADGTAGTRTEVPA